MLRKIWLAISLIDQTMELSELFPKKLQVPPPPFDALFPSPKMFLYTPSLQIALL